MDTLAACAEEAFLAKLVEVDDKGFTGAAVADEANCVVDADVDEVDEFNVVDAFELLLMVLFDKEPTLLLLLMSVVVVVVVVAFVVFEPFNCSISLTFALLLLLRSCVLTILKLVYFLIIYNSYFISIIQ